jgi:metallo-beta-lactamase family protein
MTISLKFCGAAGTVTGSCYWLRTDAASLLVDCGLFQGTKTIKALNYADFPFDPADIDAVLLTHAHIDHSGLLPKLWRAGFRGPVYMTRGSRDLLSFMLPDSAYIQETEVAFLNERNARKGRDAVTPIYTQEDALACQRHFRTVEYESWLSLPGSIRARWWNAGHILGSASIELEIPAGADGRKALRLLLSGDIGPDHKLFHPDPEASSDYDYVVCEATYGGRKRVHASPGKRRLLLAGEVKEALKADGILLIPCFAVERTQELLADLTLLMQQEAIPRVPIILDSPLAIKATKVFEEHSEELEDLGEGVSLLDNPDIHFTETAEQSKQINKLHSGAIIMAASGMCEAGRIRHHLRHHLWRPNATVLLVGYQAEGTLGRLLTEGVPTVRIQGDEVDVRARIRQIDAYSGHADETELVAWVMERKPIRRGLILTHAEPPAAQALQAALLGTGMEPALIALPQLDDEIELTLAGEALRFGAVERRLAPETMQGLDWHNDLAQLQIALKEAVDKAADERARKAMLRRLWRALEAE